MLYMLYSLKIFDMSEVAERRIKDFLIEFNVPKLFTFEERKGINV